MKIWHGALLALLIGYALGYWFPMVGKATLGKLYTPSGS
jgi:hypothetical protein